MKYLAVDIGNVVCRVDFINFKRNLSKSLNISLDEAEYFLNRTQQLHDSGLTNISDELRDHFKIRSSVIIEDLISYWNATIQPDPVMITWLNSLIDTNNVSIALLSNIGMEHSKLMKYFLKNKIFDHSIKFFSCEVGARKPSYLYYKTFLDMYPEFKGCMYLDDRMENIDAGKKLGLNSIHFVLDKFKENELTNALEKLNKIIF